MQETAKDTGADSDKTDLPGSVVTSLDEVRRQKASRTGPSKSMLSVFRPWREEDPPLPLGSVVGEHLLIVEHAGRGGMGHVYRAWHKILRRNVALKLHRTPIEPSKSAQDRFICEAQSLARFAHPNVVRIYECGFHHNRPWISMEYVRGQTLRDWGRAKPRGWQEVLGVMIEVARGIAAVHAEGMIHRDLKPENVMIGDDDRVYIVDFGLALGLRPTVFDVPDALASEGIYPENLDAKPRLTLAGEKPGTPEYMAPEQAGGGEATFASDQYAWSLMTHELLYGWRPEAGSSSAKRQSAWNVPRWVRRVVEVGLSPDPGQRWQNMEELLRKLESGRTRALIRQLLVLLGVLALIFVGAELSGRRADAARRIAAREKIEMDCQTASKKINDVWNDSRRGRLHEVLATFAVNDRQAIAERVLHRVDVQANEWRMASVEICLSLNVDRRLETHEYRRSAWCLEERRLEIDALVEALSDGSAGVAKMAIDATSELSPISLCKNQQMLSHMPPPPSGVSEKGLAEARTGLWRVNALQRTGQYDAGLSLALANMTRAESVGWRPLWAATRVQLGGLLTSIGRFQDAERVLRDAYYLAQGDEAHAVAGGAAMRLSRVIERDPSRRIEASDWWRHGEASISKLGVKRGTMEAEELLMRVRTVASRGEFVAAEAMLEDLLSAQESLLSEEHPLIAVIRVHIAELNAQAGRLAKAREQYEEALPAMESAFGAEHSRLATVLHGFAQTEAALGRTGSAKLLYQRESEILDGSSGFEP